MIRNEKGVTLVELLIVIVILGIIAAISVPAVGNIVENAERDAVLSDAQNIREAVNLYCSSENSEDDDGDDVCEDYGSDDNTERFFSNDGDNDADADVIDEGYIDDFDGSYVAWFESDELMVAIETDDYYFAGNPEDATRDDVEDSTDEIADFTGNDPTSLSSTTDETFGS